MKKILLASLVSTFVAGAAFAATVPVLDIESGNSHVGLNYSVSSHNGGHTYGASLHTALTDKVAVQYAFEHSNLTPNEGTAFNEFSGYYKLNDSFNVYAMAGEAAGTWGYQAGVVGYTPINNNLQGYAKVGIGHNFSNSLQLGVKYDINRDWDATAYFNHDNYKKTDSFNGLHVGVGYKF